MDYTGAKNHENGLLAEAEDYPDLVRDVYTIPECPLHNECHNPKKGNPMKEAQIWSYESEDQVRRYLAHHLHASSKHGCDKAHAMTLAMQADCVIEKEDFSQRQQYRDSLNNQKKWKASEWQEEQWSGDSQWAASSDAQWAPQPTQPAQPAHPPPRSDVAAIATAVATAIMQQTSAQTPVADAGGDDEDEEEDEPVKLTMKGASLALRRAPVNSDGMVQIPLERAKLICDTLERADLAIQSFCGSAVEAATKARQCQSVIEENKSVLQGALRASKKRKAA